MKIEELQKRLEEENLDAFLSVQHSHYLSETNAITAVIITSNKSVSICSRMNSELVEKESITDDIRAFNPDEVPLRSNESVYFGELEDVVKEILRESGAQKIGSDRLSPDLQEKIQEDDEFEYQPKLELVWNLRKVKTPRELEKIRKATDIAIEGMKRAGEIIEPGITELDIAAEIEYEMRKKGSEGTSFDPIIAAGENSCFPHHKPTEKKLQEGEVVVVDLGAKYDGYKSDMTRTFSLSPTSKQKKIIEIAKEAQEATLNEIEAGAPAKAVDKAARKIFSKYNYEKHFLHGTGHGVGLDIHESPNIAISSEDILKENMVITSEPGIYIPGAGGGRFEDMVVVKEDGYEIISRME